MTEREQYEAWFRGFYEQEPMPKLGAPAHDFCWAGYRAGAASRDAEVVSLTNQRDYEYVRAENAEHDRLLVKIAAKDAEIAELVAALELLSKYIAYNGDDWVQRTALEALAKVRKP